MMPDMWFTLALTASLFWGLTYAIDGQILKHISVPTMLLTHALVMIASAGAIFLWQPETLPQDIKTILSSRTVLWLVAAGTVAFIAAELAIWYSVAEGNASLAAMLEIAYPLFTILFTYLLFRETQVNMATMLGGLLIFAGATVVYIFGR